MLIRMGQAHRLRWLLLFVLISFLIGNCNASIGDRLPEFQECVKVSKHNDTNTVRGSVFID